MIKHDRHDAAHEDLLLSVACGDLERDDARVTLQLDTCPQCRVEFDEQDALAEQLDAWGDLQRQVNRDRAAGRRVAGSDLAGPFFRARAAERLAEHGARTRTKRWAPVAAAAAVLVVTAGGSWMAAEALRPRPRSAPFLLSDGDFKIWSELPAEAAPGGGASSGSWRLRWDAPLPRGGEFELRCVSSDGTQLLGPILLDEPQWRPNSAQLDLLGDEFEVKIQVIGPADERLSAGSFSFE